MLAAPRVIRRRCVPCLRYIPTSDTPPRNDTMSFRFPFVTCLLIIIARSCAPSFFALCAPLFSPRLRAPSFFALARPFFPPRIHVASLLFVGGHVFRGRSSAAKGLLALASLHSGARMTFPSHQPVAHLVKLLSGHGLRSWASCRCRQPEGRWGSGQSVALACCGVRQANTA